MMSIRDIFIFRFARSRLNVLLVLLAVLVAVLTSAIFGVMVYSNTMASVEADTDAMIENYLGQLTVSLESNIAEVERIAFSVIDENLIMLITASLSPAKAFEKQHKAQPSLLRYANFRNDIIGIYVYATDGRIFSSPRSPSLREGYSMLTQPSYQPCRDRTGFWIRYFPDGDKFLINRYADHLSFIKNINDYSSDRKLGAMEIVISAERFCEMFSDGGEAGEKSFSLYVFDEAQSLVYSKGDGETDAASAAAALKEGERYTEDVSINSKPYRAYVRRHAFSGLTLTALRPMTALAPDAGGIGSMLALCLVISLTLASVMAIFSAVKIFGPLHKLQDTMLRAARHPDERAQVRGNDEIGRLYAIFNRMMDDLNEQAEINRRLEWEKDQLSVERSRCEFDALQSQINPHMLYNALEVISMTARINGDRLSAQMAVTLGKLLRISLVRGQGRQLVAMSEELKHVELYIQFQNLFFERKIELRRDIEEGLLDSKMVKLTLQPVVENAVKHGYEGRADARIEIIARRGEDAIVVHVIDDGRGMTKDTMDGINALLAKRERGQSPDSGVGLANTNMRIYLAFLSDRYALRIERSDESGTDVRITLPRVGEGDL